MSKHIYRKKFVRVIAALNFIEPLICVLYRNKHFNSKEVSMIYTSYFGRMNSRKYGHLKDKGISIAKGNKYWDGEQYPDLFPTWDIIKKAHDKTITEEEYEKIYRETVLNKLDPAKVAEDLNGRILLCWEKTADVESGEAFCHRYMVARWLKKNGFEAEELK